MFLLNILAPAREQIFQYLIRSSSFQYRCTLGQSILKCLGLVKKKVHHESINYFTRMFSRL